MVRRVCRGIRCLSVSLPKDSLGSETERGMEYRIISITLKTKSSKMRIQITYDDGAREIVKDPCHSRFGALLLGRGGVVESKIAMQSLRMFSRFLLDQTVQVSHGLDCWNLLCSGLDCGIRSSRGMVFSPPEDLETYGNISSSPEEEGYYKVHVCPPISNRRTITNVIKLRTGRWYLVAGQLDTTPTPQANFSFRRRFTCQCEQCFDDEESIEREVVEAIINPLEILSLRYQNAQVVALGTWFAGSRALVHRDKDDNFRIIAYLRPEVYEEDICDFCKRSGKVTKCENQCWRYVSRWNGTSLDIVEPGSAAVQAPALEFCLPRFRKLRKALRQVIHRLDSLGVRDGGRVLSDLAWLVRATREEVVSVLNNDKSLVQPIIGGANCFLRRDTRGRWNSCETLTGSELKGKLFFVDPAGAWIMIGSGERYGVLETETGKYHLDVEGENMVCGDHLDTQEFGGAVT